MTHNDPLSPPDWPADSQSAKALQLYRISGRPVALSLVRSTLVVKKAALRCNRQLGFIADELALAIESSIDALLSLDDGRLRAWFELDAYQGGAGTALHMMVCEAISLLAQRLFPQHGRIDPLHVINLHQSTNDVMPTALHLMLLDELLALESRVAALQDACQIQEQRWAGLIIPAHTQLQDAVAMSAGRVFATWAGVLQRDRWRIFKARERLKEVNLGGTAIGTGAGAPRSYVLGVIRHLQALVPHPVSRADDALEATSNYDAVAEAMSVVNVLAQSLKRIGTDIRLLASGPSSGMGLLVLPRLVKGSTIMPGKVNPVIAEAAVQVGERVMANDGLIGRLCSQSELQLNAFYPLIAETCSESLSLLNGVCPALAEYIAQLRFNPEVARRQLHEGTSANLSLSPLLGYHCVEALIHSAADHGRSLGDELIATGLLPPELIAWVLDPKRIQGMGYDEAEYQRVAQTYAQALAALKENMGCHDD